MGAIRMDHLKLIGSAEQLIDRLCRFRDRIHAAPFEIVISQRRADETTARSERSDQFVKIERKLVERIIQQAWHVTLMGPPLDVSALIIAERIKPAARDDDADAFIKDRRINAVMAAERVADNPEPIGPHKPQGFQVIQPAHVVPDRLHRAALIAEPFEFGIVVGEDRVGRSKHHEARLTSSTPYSSFVLLPSPTTTFWPSGCV